MTADVVPANGRHLAHGFPDSTFNRARALMLQYHSYPEAWRKLKVELEKWGQLVPGFTTIKEWGKADKDVIAAIQPHEKRDIGETFQDVAEDYAEAMIEARPHLSHSQIPVSYGIAADKPIAWAKAGVAASVQAIQINITDSKGGDAQFGPTVKSSED